MRQARRGGGGGEREQEWGRCVTTQYKLLVSRPTPNVCLYVKVTARGDHTRPLARPSSSSGPPPSLRPTSLPPPPRRPLPPPSLCLRPDEKLSSRKKEAEGKPSSLSSLPHTWHPTRAGVSCRCHRRDETPSETFVTFQPEWEGKERDGRGGGSQGGGAS